MKKYKLKEKYPGSPEIGKILEPKVDIRDFNTNNYYWEGTWFNPKDFPNFWEEVVEDNYEILSVFGAKDSGNFNTVYTIKNSHILVHPGGGEYNNDNFRSIKDYPIHSIKRLSDGEIFTVGDSVKHPFTKYSEDFNLRKIIIATDPSNQVVAKVAKKALGKLMLCVDNDNANLFLEDAVKIIINKPLFTTEDGVEVFKGDTIYYIGITDFIISSSRANELFQPHISFSTEELAKEYVKMNKPEFSRNHILNLLDNLKK
jgi:hypothetical protein